MFIQFGSHPGMIGCPPSSMLSALLRRVDQCTPTKPTDFGKALAWLNCTILWGNHWRHHKSVATGRGLPTSTSNKQQTTTINTPPLAPAPARPTTTTTTTTKQQKEETAKSRKKASWSQCQLKKHKATRCNPTSSNVRFETSSTMQRVQGMEHFADIVTCRKEWKSNARCLQPVGHKSWSHTLRPKTTARSLTQQCPFRWIEIPLLQDFLVPRGTIATIRHWN